MMEKAVFTICMTILFCISFRIALQSWAGICADLCMGMAFGLFDIKKEKKQ